MECSLIKRVCLFLLWVGGAAQANAEQGCPYPSSVKYVSGYFQASDKQSHWRSPKVDANDFADRFIGALFTPGKGQDRENGFLDRCVYLMGSGRSLALRYDMPGGPQHDVADQVPALGTRHRSTQARRLHLRGQPAGQLCIYGRAPELIACQ